MPPKKPKKKGKWKRRIVKTAAVGAIGALVAGCAPKSKQPQFIMRDLNQPGNRGKVFNYVPQEFQHSGKFALDGSAPKGTGARKGKPRPVPKQTTAMGPSGLWPKIFEIYPQWRPETNKGRAATNLVMRVSRSAGIRPVDVLRIKEEHYVTKYYLARAKAAGKLSRTEIRVIELLIEASKNDRAAYHHLHRLTVQTWGSKKKVQQLTEGK